MRKSTVTALALVAGLGFAAPAHAEDGGTAAKTEAAKKEAAKTEGVKTEGVKTAAGKTVGKTKAAHRRAGSGHRVAGSAVGQVGAPPAPTGFMRIPEHPLIRDCTHVAFPQCSGRGGLNPLNDGDFPLHE